MRIYLFFNCSYFFNKVIVFKTNGRKLGRVTIVQIVRNTVYKRKDHYSYSHAEKARIGKNTAS